MQTSQGNSRAAKNKKKRSLKLAQIGSSEDTPKLPKTEEESSESLIQFSPAIEKYDDMPLFEALKLKDVIDVECATKSAIILSKFISPTLLGEFYSSYWEKKPISWVRAKKGYFKKIFSKKSLEQIFENQLLFETVDIEFYSPEYTFEEPEPVELNKATILANFDKGYTIKLLPLAKYHDNTWKMLSSLEHQFNTMVGANILYTPASQSKLQPSSNIQSDIYDAFILQLEGENQWKIFQKKPNNNNHDDNGNNNNELDDDNLITYHDVTLKSGDSLYIPKGWLYQQYNHSSNEAISMKIYTNETNTHSHFIDLLLPQAINEATSKNKKLTKALPSNYHTYMGVAHSETEIFDSLRETFKLHIQSLLSTITNTALELLDPAIDQMRKKFIQERLPVPLTKHEESLTNHSNNNSNNRKSNVIFPYTKLRMLRPGIAIAVVEDGMLVVYHCMDNSRELFGSPLNPLEFELDDGLAIEALLHAYPESIMVSDLEHPSEELEDKVSIAQALFKEGFLVIDDDASKNNNIDDSNNNDDDDPF